MAEKFTPGPWVVGNDGYRVFVKPERPSFDWVCTVQVSNVPEWQDNASFIASAPEMFAALERGYGVLRDYVHAAGEPDKADLDTLNAMRAAIQTALGVVQ